MILGCIFERSYTVTKLKKPTILERIMDFTQKRKRSFRRSLSRRKKRETEIINENQVAPAELDASITSKGVSFGEKVEICDRKGRIFFRRLKVDDKPSYFAKRSLRLELSLKFPFRPSAKIDNTYYYYTNEQEQDFQVEDLMTDDEDEIPGESKEKSITFNFNDFQQLQIPPYKFRAIKSTQKSSHNSLANSSLISEQSQPFHIIIENIFFFRVFSHLQSRQITACCD